MLLMQLILYIFFLVAVNFAHVLFYVIHLYGHAVSQEGLV